MRIIKAILLLLVLLVGSLFLFIGVVYPVIWHSETRRQSIQILQAAHTTAALTNAVGDLGWFVQLTNHDWIAIRYRDTHSGFVGSVAIARDSGGKWFESDRHFCGSFMYWPQLREEVRDNEEWRKLQPDSLPKGAPLADSNNGMFPSYREMVAIESAPDLQSARIALQKIGFQKLRE